MLFSFMMWKTLQSILCSKYLARCMVPAIRISQQNVVVLSPLIGRAHHPQDNKHVGGFKLGQIWVIR